MKKITVAILIIFLLMIGFLSFSKYKASTIENYYGLAYNQRRLALGLSEIESEWEVQKRTWNSFFYNEAEYDELLEDFVPVYSDFEVFINGWKYILLKNNDLITSITYTPKNEKSRMEYLLDKKIEFSTSIFPWKNKILSEIDTYEKIIQNKKFRLEKEYHYNGFNIRTDKYDTTFILYSFYEIEPTIMCGLGIIEKLEKDNEIYDYYSGNISVNQGDSILREWKRN